MTQTTLDVFGRADEEDIPDDHDHDPEPEPAAVETVDEDAPDERFRGLACPWCHADASHFRHREVCGGEARVWGCGNCDASLPTDAQWFLDGEQVTPAPTPAWSS